MESLVCFPGERICSANENTIASEGTYERLGYIHASLAGKLEVKNEEKVNIFCFNFENFTLFQFLLFQNIIVKVMSPGQKTLLPAQGDIVTAKVEIVNQRMAKCSIFCIGDVLLSRSLRGILRKEDVRATNVDNVEMYKCYRPGDIILAKILPQIELHTYSLTTAENELGVVSASARG